MQSPTKTPSNLRTLLILEVLGKSDRPMTATEINAVLHLPKQTVHRLCATLEEFGFITRLSNSKEYQVARRLREVGAGLLYNSRDHIMRRQILLDVAQEVGETVNFAVPRNTVPRFSARPSIPAGIPLTISFSRSISLAQSSVAGPTSMP